MANTGTVTVTTGSKIVEGVGTKFTDAGAGDFFNVDGGMYFIEDIQSDTKLTLKTVYPKETKSGIDYAIETSNGVTALEKLAVPVSELTHKYSGIANAVGTAPSAGGIPKARENNKIDDAWIGLATEKTQIQENKAKFAEYLPLVGGQMKGNIEIGGNSLKRDNGWEVAPLIRQKQGTQSNYSKLVEWQTPEDKEGAYLPQIGRMTNFDTRFPEGYIMLSPTVTAGDTKYGQYGYKFTKDLLMLNGRSIPTCDITDHDNGLTTAKYSDGRQHTYGYLLGVTFSYQGEKFGAGSGLYAYRSENIVWPVGFKESPAAFFFINTEAYSYRWVLLVQTTSVSCFIYLITNRSDSVDDLTRTPIAIDVWGKRG